MTRCARPTREYRYGIVEEESALLLRLKTTDGCPFPHRRKVKWSEQPIIKERSVNPVSEKLERGQDAI